MLIFTLAPLALSAVRADSLFPGYGLHNISGVAADGQFTASGGEIHYWSSSRGYQIYNTTSGSTTTIGLPPNGTITNTYGDAFGVFDPANNVFYAATLASNFSANLYEYHGATGTWSNSTSAGVYLPNAYGGQICNGQLYVSRGAAPGFSTTSNIVRFDQNAIPGGPAPQTLIQSPGYAAYVAVAPDGDVYYATNSYGSSGTDNLYRWTAQQVAGVTTPLTTGNAVQSWALPGNGNGVAVDSAGNVFFSVNNSFTGASILGMLDATASSGLGYDEIYTSDNYTDSFGAISVDGDFLKGGTLYFNPGIGYVNSVAAVQVVPEPGSLVLLAVAAAVAVVARHLRRA